MPKEWMLSANTVISYFFPFTDEVIKSNRKDNHWPSNKCPVDAISVDTGKNHRKCSEFLDITREKYKPRYGCGKCQVSVPCERRIP